MYILNNINQINTIKEIDINNNKEIDDLS
jgi:hypothetical protein